MKETWRREAEEQGFSSMSKYIAAKIGQARADDHVDTKSGERTEELQERIAELEQQLEDASTAENRTGTVSVLDDGVVKQNLSYQCKTLEELLRDLIEDTAADQLIRKPVETRLCELAADQQVEYQRGARWRLKQGEKR